MRVEQAIYGEVGRGHGLRAFSGVKSRAAELSQRLDLPDTAPPGANWSPFISGFPHRDRYVIARTFRDPAATRAGIVLSHAIIAPLDEIIDLNELSPVLDKLIKLPAVPEELADFELTPSSILSPKVLDLDATAAALAARGAGPVVRVGSVGFDLLVAALWRGLWPSLRRRFNFRLSFGPGDLVEEPQPVLICTPATLIARWQGYRVVDNFNGQPITLAGAILASSPVGQPVKDFVSTMGAELTSFSQLSLIEQAYRLASVEPDNLINVLAATRLVERLSPDPKQGRVGKSELVNRLALHLEDATAEEILALRNLELKAFATANTLWYALHCWTETSTFPASEDGQLVTVLREALLPSDASPPWRQAIAGGVAAIAKGGLGAFSEGFWRWGAQEPELVSPMLSGATPRGIFEKSLAANAPRNIDFSPARHLLQAAADRQLYLLHAAAAAAALPPIEAARSQIAIEPHPNDEGVRLALSYATPAQLVDCASEIHDQRIVQLAGHAVAMAPTLLQSRDLTKVGERIVWTAALAEDLTAWHGPSDPRAQFDTLLDELLDGAQPPSELLDLLSQTPLADITRYNRRAKIWPLLKDPTRTRVLIATTTGWLRDVVAKGDVPVVEPELQARLLRDPQLDAILNGLPEKQIGRAVQIMSALTNYDETNFRRWLRSALHRCRAITPFDAEAIGRLIVSRGWIGATDDLVHNLTARREDLRPALRICVSLLGWWDRWRLSLAPVTTEEKWASIVELAGELYPMGPDEEGLWARAGGKDADLAHNGSGRSRWREALEGIRRGRKPTIAQLLNEMQRDYPDSERLRMIRDDPNFKGA